MAAAEYAYVESTANTSADSGTGFQDFVRMESTSFDASATYLVLANCYFTFSSGSQDSKHSLVHGEGAGTAFTDSANSTQLSVAGAGQGIAWMHVYTQPGTPEDIAIRGGGSGTADNINQLAQIFVLKLDDLSASDWEYNEVTGDYTTTSSKVAQATVNVDPDNEPWLVIAHVVWDPGGVSTSFLWEIHDSVTGAVCLCQEEAGDVTNDIRSRVVAWVFTGVDGARDWSIRVAHETATAHSVLSTRIFALKLSAFDQYIADTTAGDEAVNATFETLESASITPDATGPFFYLGALLHDVDSDATLTLRLQDDDDGSIGSDPAYGDDMPGDYWKDDTDITPFQIFKAKNLTSGGSRTINLDGQDNGAGIARNRMLAGFSLELAGGAAPASLVYSPPPPIMRF